MKSGKTVAAIVVAAGRGERAASGGQSEPKQYRPLLGVPVLKRTIEALLAIDTIAYVLPVLHPDHVERYRALGIAHDRLLPPAVGGATR